MQTTNIQIRVKTTTKSQAMAVLDTYDLTMSEAFRLFLNEIIRTKSIPVNLQPNTKSDEDFDSHDLLLSASKNLGITSKNHDGDDLIQDINKIRPLKFE